MRLRRLTALGAALVLLGVKAMLASSIVVATEDACANGRAVPDPDNNPGLVSDCVALLAARDTLAGSVALNWAVDTPVAQWKGVAVRGTPQRVTRLDLREMGLNGTIPGELGLLSSLTQLNLRTNRLNGAIPAEFGNLSRLERLLLHDNQLSGPIPDLSGLGSLKMLWLSGREMSLTGTVPGWLSLMGKLESVSLWGNALSGPIPDLTGMTSLKLLKLQSNNLSGGVPAWLGDMSSTLRGLYIHDNPLGGTIPPELGRLTRLRRLWMHSSGLTGSIPPELGEMTGLWGLNLRDNRLTGSIPAELGGLTNIRKLRLHNNMLSGGIPVELGDLSNLTDIWLSGNELTGSIPFVLGRLDYLEELSLRNNELSGDIPTYLGKLAGTLTHLFLDGNGGLTGCVPAGLEAVANNDISELGLGVCEPSPAEDRVIVRDVFGRVVNETGIVLIDWEGHIANPAMKYSVELPHRTATLSSSEPRLYFDLPSSTGANGSTKALVSQDPRQGTEFRVSIFPDRDTSDESHTLTIRYRDGGGRVRSETIGVYVIDEDVDLPLDFKVTVDFSYDETGMFDDPLARMIVQQAADDFTYFISDMGLDEVPAGEESMWIWDPGGYVTGRSVTNAIDYTGFLMNAYGHPHSGLTAGGAPSCGGRNQSSGGVELPLERSGSVNFDPRGNYNTLGWMVSADETDWWKATNFFSRPHDLYSIGLHEIGHALIFHDCHDGFAGFYEAREVRDPIVKAYYGSYPRMDVYYHFLGTIDPVSGRGGFGNEYGGETPDGRWLVNKLTLLIAQAAGYSLRATSPFTEMSIPDEPLPEGNVGAGYAHTMDVVGGVAAYYWTIDSGVLPEGLSLDSFTGTISGTPVETGIFGFVVRVRDSIEGGPGITRSVTLNVRS